MNFLQRFKTKIKRSLSMLKPAIVEEVPAEVVGCMMCNETGCTHEEIQKCPNRQYHEKMYSSHPQNPPTPPPDNKAGEWAFYSGNQYPSVGWSGWFR